MLPRVVLRMRKVVGRFRRPAETALTGEEIEARWRDVMSAVHQPDRDAERRLERAERALNSLGRR